MVSHCHSSLKWAFHSYILWRLEASSNTAARPAIEDFHPHLQPVHGHCGQNISRTSRSAPGLIDQQIPGAGMKRDLPARVWSEPGPVVSLDLDTEPKGVVLKVSWRNRSHGLRSAWRRKEEGGGEVEVLLHKTLEAGPNCEKRTRKSLPTRLRSCKETCCPSGIVHNKE